MPLETGSSKGAFSHNVETEMNEGKPKKQAVAIAYREAQEPKNDDIAARIDVICDAFGCLRDRFDALVNSYGSARSDSFNEKDHPRAKDGKFGSGGSPVGGGKPHSSDRKISFPKEWGDQPKRKEELKSKSLDTDGMATFYE